jgi:hypothetical protein
LVGLSNRQLQQKHVTDLLARQPVVGRMLAITGRGLAICPGRGPVPSRYSAVNTVERPQRAITPLGGLVTGHCHPIPSPRKVITGSSLKSSLLMGRGAVRPTTIVAMILCSRRVHIHLSAPPPTNMTRPVFIGAGPHIR